MSSAGLQLMATEKFAGLTRQQRVGVGVGRELTVFREKKKLKFYFL